MRRYAYSSTITIWVSICRHLVIIDVSTYFVTQWKSQIICLPSFWAETGAELTVNEALTQRVTTETVKRNEYRFAMRAIRKEPEKNVALSWKLSSWGLMVVHTFVIAISALEERVSSDRLVLFIALRRSRMQGSKVFFRILLIFPLILIVR